MRRSWLRAASMSVFFIGSTGLTGSVLAKPKPPAKVGPSPVVRATPRKVVGQSRAHGPQGSSTSGVRVYRDPDTGEIREGTHEEAQVLAGQRNGTAALVPPSLRQVTYSDGSVAVELDDSYTTDVVVERAADGTVHMRCGSTGERAHAPAPPPATPPVETE
jgi:hypothetical protein